MAKSSPIDQPSNGQSLPRAIDWLLRVGHDSAMATRPSESRTRAPPGQGHEHVPGAIELRAEPRHVDIGEIDRGGMGRVRLVRDMTLRREVAMKLLAPDLAAQEEYVARFVDEAQIAGQMDHPNILPIHELGVDANGTPYFTMKAVHGQSLYCWLSDSRRPPGSAERVRGGLEILLKVCDAISFAHGRGVIHRDLKTDNVMVGDHGEVYVMDWGLALLLGHGVETLTDRRRGVEKASPVGTIAYMSPEAARGEGLTCDARSDVFGLGAILYEIVTGVQPYGGNGSSSSDVLEKAKRGEYTPVEEAMRGVGVSQRLVGIVHKAMATAREERYQTAADLKSSLQRFLCSGFDLPQRAFAPGTRILAEGERGDAVYVIVKGRCQMTTTIDGQTRVVRSLGPGDVFGERALVRNAPRTANVDAIDAVTALVVGRSDLEEELGKDTWVWALVEALAQR
jgi:eukaryotic-like serine/threonine-protein kinase